jgi:hypothetical protein
MRNAISASISSRETVEQWLDRSRTCAGDWLLQRESWLFAAIEREGEQDTHTSHDGDSRRTCHSGSGPRGLNPRTPALDLELSCQSRPSQDTQLLAGLDKIFLQLRLLSA